MKKRILISAMAALTIFGSSALANTAKTYAQVNGEAITATDIAIVLKDPRIKFDQLPKETQHQILKQLVEKKLLSQKAINSDVVNDKLYKETLENTIKTLKQDLALQMWMQKLSKEITVTENEAKQYYEKNKAKFKRPLELKASHILVKTKKEAQDIINTLNKSKNLKADFTKLAKEKSTGPSGANGGELGWFSLNKMVPSFSNAAAKLKVGTITQKPVKTQFGYHVIYLDDKKDAQVATFDKIKNQIKQLIGQQKFKAKIEQIVKDAKAKAKIIYN